MNIGVLGGTFDPIHLGHLAVAEEACHHLKMAKVIFIPAGHPYFKPSSSISPSKHRINMLNLAIVDKPYFEISLIEVKRRGPSYAVDTISQMKRQLAAGDEIFFILGWDSLLTLHLWHAPERLISLCHLVGAPDRATPGLTSTFWK